MMSLSKPNSETSVVSRSTIILTEKQLAERWGKSVSSLQNDRLAGKGVPHLKLGGSVRYLLTDVEAYELSARRMSTSRVGDQP